MSVYDDFAPIYDVWAADMVDDVDFYADLATEADGPVVELAVGTGRVAIPVAGRTGRGVIGIDSSPAMLAVARERASAAEVDLDLRERDLRELALDEPAPLELEDGPRISLWWVTRSEWEGLLDVAGLETEALYGWFDRRPFDEASREFVWVARKPG